MANQELDGPELMFDLGDTFDMNPDTRPNKILTPDMAFESYMNQRVYFDDIAHSTPLFLVPGNHENEEGWNLDDFVDGDTFNYGQSLPVLSVNARKRYFLNPVPDLFYSGNEDTGEGSVPPGSDQLQQLQDAIDGDGLKEEYYAFEWGNVLFVAIDPFWYTTVKPFENFGNAIAGELSETVTGDRWDWTLGERQYRWLKETLENSDAEFKFVFSHHILGGKVERFDGYVRGGVAGAHLCEWGGHQFGEDNNSLDTPWQFHQRRPDFELPIHQMMVANGVTIFFHGHDHQFAREELDGLVYVGLPHPAKARYDDGFGYYNEDEVHVNGGETTYVANNSGYIRVEVDSDQISYAYVRNFLRTTCRDGACNHDVQYEETISAPEGTNTKPVANPDQVTVVRNSGDNSIDVLANDEDADMDVLTIIGANQPLHGTVTPVETEATTLIYTPNADYCNSEADPTEPDTFSYVISDGNGRTATATVQVTVQCETPVDTDADAGTGDGGSQ